MDKVLFSVFNPDASLVLTGSEDKTARIWDSRTGSLIRVLEGHKSGVQVGSFSEDGRRIFTFERDDEPGDHARIWDANTGRLLKQPKIGHINNDAIANISDAIFDSVDANFRMFGNFDERGKLFIADVDSSKTSEVPTKNEHFELMYLVGSRPILVLANGAHLIVDDLLVKKKLFDLSVTAHPFLDLRFS